MDDKKRSEDRKNCCILNRKKNAGRLPRNWIKCVQDDIQSRNPSLGLCSARHLAMKNKAKYKRDIVYPAEWRS